MESVVSHNKIGQFFMHLICVLLCIACVAPFILLIVSSLTEEATLMRNGYSFWPEVWSLETYLYILRKGSTILRAYGITVFVTVVGTVVSILITLMFSYPLSRKELPFRYQLSFFVFFTMLFNGGIVTTYYVWTNYFNIRNSFWALVLPNLLMSAFNVMLVKNYFKFSIPESLLEAARIDGAGEIRIFAKIVMPLSLPILATIGLMTAITYWNDWTNGLYYLTDRGGSHLFTIQLVLNKINENINFLAQNASALGSGVDVSSIPTTTARMAIAVVGILPILIAYPFFQRFFVKGIMLGGVKE